jgi:hypothetical protein
MKGMQALDLVCIFTLKVWRCSGAGTKPVAFEQSYNGML